jgi:heptosyltransferase-2
MKVLIIQTAFTGDVILATPMIEKIHQFYPNACIDFLLKKGNEGLFENHPFINQILILDKKQGKVKQLWSLMKQIRAKKYDYVINLHRFLSSGILVALSGAKHKIGFDKNPLSFTYTVKKTHLINQKGNFVHEIDRNLSLIQDFTDSKTTKPKLYPSDKDYNNVKINTEYICIAPASVWFTKQFPLKKWIELIDHLPSNIAVKLLGGPTDTDLCNNIKNGSKHQAVTVMAGQLNFLESAALMQHARMNFVNDSAPLHMASATNAPVAAIFCSTIAAFGFTPVSDISFLIESNNHLPCRPCGLHGHKACPLGHFNCADLDVKAILKKVGF